MKLSPCIKHVLLMIVTMSICVNATAQITTIKDEKQFNIDSVVRDFDRRPSFGLYKDNYFTLGTSLDKKPSEYNSNVKFQISISQRITRSTLPFHSYLFLFYTQRCIWNIFEESLPFHDLNFNPGIGITKLIIRKDKLIGKATLQFEHESNGRDGNASRSWNKLSHCGSLYITPSIMIHEKIWIPIIDGKNNKDILDYCGIFQVGAQYVSPNKRWVFDMTFAKRKGWNLNFNTTIDVGFSIFKKHNQFLMLHFYDGYGENLLDYNKYHCRLSLGLLIRPTLFSDF